jgi:hypothetical protein
MPYHADTLLLRAMSSAGLAVAQCRREVLTGIIGARRACTVSMISTLSMPRRSTEVMPQVAVAELPLDDDQRHAFASHLDRVGVSELVRSKTPAHTRCGGCPAKVGAGRSVGPPQAACRAVDDAEERPDGKLESDLEPWMELVPAPCVHSDIASTSALAAPD